MPAFEFHPLANIFPLMSDAELRELADDIRKNCQEEPVILWGGKIIDGRNRALAIEMLEQEDGITESCLEYEDMSYYFDSPTVDPLSWVITKNLRRRHLSESQRAMVAVKVKELEAEAAKERQRMSEGRGVKKGQKNSSDLKVGDSRDLAGKQLGVSGFSVNCAEKVVKNAEPELREAVKRGDVPVSSAAVIADQPPEVQRDAVAGGKKGVVEAAKRVRKRKQKERKFDLDKQTKSANDAIEAVFNEWPEEQLVHAVDLLRQLADRIEKKLQS